MPRSEDMVDRAKCVAYAWNIGGILAYFAIAFFQVLLEKFIRLAVKVITGLDLAERHLSGSRPARRLG